MTVKNKQTKPRHQYRQALWKVASKCDLRDYKNTETSPVESVIRRIIITTEGTLMAFSTCSSLLAYAVIGAGCVLRSCQLCTKGLDGLSSCPFSTLSLPVLLRSLLGLILFRTPTAIPVLFQQWAREVGFLLTWSQVGLITLYLKELIFLQILCKSVPRRTCQKGWEELSHLPLAVQNVHDLA